VIELGPPGARYRIHNPGGGGKVAKTLRTGVPWEALVLDDMRSLGLRGLAVDAGANIGNHALWLAVVCGLRVAAFEPVHVEALTANVALNGLEDRIAVHPVALGSYDDFASHAGKGKLAVDGGGPIRVRTLDSFRLDPALLKIDTEGMETDVIRGGLGTIERCRPVIYAEAWDDTYSAATGKLLEPLGYRMARGFRWHQQRWDPR